MISDTGSSNSRNGGPGRAGRSGLGILTLAALLCVPARAQEPDPASLDAVLSQLKQTDPKAWQARGAAMKAAAADLRKAAVKLREQSAAKTAAAAVETGLSERLTAEVGKLAELRAAVTKMTFRDPAGRGDASGAEAEQGRLEAALAALQKLSAAAWDARSGAMRAAASAHDERGKDLAKQAAGLTAEAAAKDAAAKTLDEELGKLEALRRLVATMQLDLAGAGSAATGKAEATSKKAEKAAMPAPAPGKPQPDKPQPDKPQPDKPQPGKPQPGKPAPKKAAMPAATPAADSPTKPADGDFVTYVDHVYPIFESHCFDCHDDDDPSSGLDLSSYATAIQGGSSGRTIRPGNPDESRLFLLVSHREKPTMPPDEPRIDDALVAKIRAWIAQGAAKDLAHAKKLAAERAARPSSQQAAAAGDRLEVAAVMPSGLPAVKKAWPPHPGAMRAVAAAPAAPLLAVPGFHQVLLLRRDDLEELGALEFPFGRVGALSFSADGTALLAAGGTPGVEGGAVLYDVRTGAELGRFGEQRDVVLAAAVSPRAGLVAVGTTRKKLEVFRVRDGRSLWQQKHEDWVTAVAFSTDGELVASGDRQGFLQVREARNGREVHAMKAAGGVLADLAFSPDSAMLAVAAGDRSVCLYRMRDGRRLFRESAHRDQVLCVAWRGRTHLLSSGADGRILHWKTNGRRETELPRVGEWVYDVAVAAAGGDEGASLFAADWQGRLTVVDIASGKVARRITPLAVTQ